MVGHWDVVSLAGGWRISGKGKGGAVERGEGVNNCKLFAFRSAPVPQPMQQSSPELARQAAGTPKETAPRNNQNLAKQGKKTFSLVKLSLGVALGCFVHSREIQSVRGMVRVFA